MKHTVPVTVYLILLFLISQMVGIAVVNQYIDHTQTEASGNVTYSELPMNMERPPVEEKNNSWIYVMVAVIVGTLLIFVLIKFRKPKVWKYWFLFAVFFCLLFAFYPFFKNVPYGQYIVAALAAGLALYKVFKRNVIIHNVTEVLMYGGLGAIFVPVMNLFSVTILLILISLYDMFAVWQSKHMVKLAQFQTESKLFAGLMIPYKNPDASTQEKEKKQKQENQQQKHTENLEKKEKAKTTAEVKKVSTKKETTEKVVVASQRNAVLGGGDIGFPIIFTGVILSDLVLRYSLLASLSLSFIITITTTAALAGLLLLAKKDRFYPAMPFISAGCFVGLGIVKLITLLM
jgi:presenilin-like A22 family membrane protease